MQPDTHGQQPAHHASPLQLFTKTAQLAAGMSGICGKSFIVIARHRPGLHTLALSNVIPVAFLMLTWNYILDIVINLGLHNFVQWVSFGFLRMPWVSLPDSPIIQVLAILMLILAPFKRWLAWRALFLNRGWYTYAMGDSYLCFVLPFLRRDLVNRLVEPALCAFLGFQMYQANEYALGVWLMVSAVSV